MLISHSRKFVFVRGIRNAGTTTKAALSTLLNNDDRISAYNPAEIPVLEEAGYRIEQHNAGRDGRTMISFQKHWDLADLYRIYPKLVGYDVIGMCRNPYDKAYSFGKWVIMADRYRRGLEPARATPELVREYLKAYIRISYEKEDSVASYGYVFHDQTTGSRTVIRFEHLEEDLRDVFAKYGAEMPALFRFKDSSKVLDLPWQEVLTKNEIALVNRIMEKDFEAFGYEML